MNSLSENPQSPTDREIVSTRLFAASREQVFQAWTDPAILVRWWGPKGFRNTFHEFDPRPGGVWRFVMHGPDGADYKNESVFREIEKPARIVFDHLSSPRFQVTATFDEEGEKTRVTFRMLFESLEALDRVKGFVPECNEQNFDRLEAQLGLMPVTESGAAGAGSSPLSERELMITRIIDAPRERVFKAWTTRLSEWWGPHGMTTPFCEMDLRPGGVFRTVMRAPDGSEYPTKGVFLEIVENERIVFTDAYGPGWEPSTEIFFTAITTFDALPGGKTRYTARALHWTVENRQKHEAMGFHHGWGESIDRLAALLARP